MADGETLGERTTRPQALLADVDALLAAARRRPRRPDGDRRRNRARELHRHPDRAGGRPRARALARPSGGRRLDARGARCGDRTARFPSSTHGAARCSSRARWPWRPRASPSCPGAICVGNGAMRYRDLLEGARRRRSPRTIPSSMSRAPRCTPSLATRFGPADAVEPVYVREPDASAVGRVSFSLRTARARRPRCDREDRASVVSRRPGRGRCSPSELAKQSSLSIAAVTPDGELVGYLVLSRYVDAWHVMNVAVDPDHRRLGIASAMLARLFEVTRDDAQRGYTLEVRVSNTRRDQPVRELRLRLAWRPTWLLH